MNRLLLIIILATLTTLVANASRVDRRTAQKTAQVLLSRLHHSDVSVSELTESDGIKDRLALNRIDTPQFYIFNSSDDAGFVIVSGDDALPLVLGYSDTSSFPSDGDLPPALEAYLDFCRERIDDLRSQGAPSLASTPSLTAGTTVVEPLCSALWGQGSPYNDLCPEKRLVGCVALAMAEIMHKWQWPETGTGRMSYISPAGLLTTDFSQSQYDWTNMQISGNTSDASKAAVSKLCYDCGVAVKMQYGEEGSSSHIEYATRALAKYFRYKASTIDIYYRDAITSQDAWNARLKAELDAGRPVLYAAAAPNISVGHAFVVDGYDTDFNLHVNWGWTGRYNGYFAISTLDPTGDYHFTIEHHMTCGIQPDIDGSDTQLQQLHVYLDEAPVAKETEVSVTDSFTVVGKRITNYTVTSAINAMVGLCDVNGQFIEPLDSVCSNEEFFIGFGNTLLSYDFKVRLPDRQLADGYYTLRLFFQENGFKGWQLPCVTGGNHLNAVYLYVDNGKVTFGKIPTPVAAISIDKTAPHGIFNLAGQRSSHLMPGINIVGGKKIKQ